MTDPARDVDRVRAEIELTRSEIAHTVDELQSRLAVRTLARRRAEDAQDFVTRRYAAAKASAPPPVQHAVAALEGRAAPLVERVRADPRRAATVLGAALAAVVLVRRLRA